MCEFDRKKFGEKLRSLRKNMSITQSQLSQKTGFSQNAISNWENGNREPESISDLLKLATALGVDVSYFVDNEQKPLNDWRDDFVLESENKYGDHNKNLEYFSDKPELLDLYKDIHESESLQLLFDSARDLEPEDLETVLIHIQGIRKARGLD